MPSRPTTITLSTLLACILVFSAPSRAADAPDAQPAAGQTPKKVARPVAAPSAGGLTPKQITEEIQSVGQELAPLFASPQDLFDPQKRQAAAPKAIPALKRMLQLLDELNALRGTTGKGQEKTQLTALLSALGDAQATDQLKTLAASPVAGEAAAGRSAQLFVHWLLSNADAAKQQAVIDELTASAKKYPNEPALAAAAVMLAGTTRPDATDLRQRIGKAVTENLKGAPAQSAARQIDQLDKRYAAQQKLKAMEGKPLTLEGASASGTQLSTAQWKGKVVLVDFWATWCGPCREELPKVKKVYAQYHSQGLEVLGVSCDNSGDDLSKFLGENKDMPWPQLFNAAEPGWHPLATQFGVQSIPTMFLIDRKGVLRSVEARANYEKLIPELLKEKAQ